MTAGCGCACTSGGFCGGCGHAGCGRRQRGRPVAPARPVRLENALVALDAEEMRVWLSEHDRTDLRFTHAVVDQLMLAALVSIRDGHPDPAGLATAVLAVAQDHFPRWFA
ncbi:hypothetical protein GCM10027436_65230 [Actinophytocola sediminis]